MLIKSLKKAQEIIKYPGGAYGLGIALQQAPRNKLRFPQGTGDAYQRDNGIWDYEFDLEMQNDCSGP